MSESCDLLILAPRNECQDSFVPWQVAHGAKRCATDTTYNLWVEAFLDAGVCFPFDEEQRLPRELPESLEGYRCIMIDPERAGEFQRGPAAQRLRLFREQGGHVFVPATAAPPPHSIQGQMQRTILTAGLRQRSPDMLARLRAVPDEKLLRWWRESLAEQARVLIEADAGWAWGDPMVYHMFWPAEAAAEHFGDDALRCVIWDSVREGLDPNRWPKAVCYGGRWALKYYERFGGREILERVVRESRFAHGGAGDACDWRLDGVTINSDLRAPAGVDPDNPPPKVRENAWAWPETAASLGNSLAYLSKVTGDPSHAEAAVRQVLTTHRWCFDRSINLWYHVGRASGPDYRTAPWGRGNGWFLYAVRGLLEDLPAEHPARVELVRALRDGLDGFVRFQGPQGLWHNVLNAPEGDSRQDSCTAWMFTNVYARAYWKGWLRDGRIPEMCEKAWQGLKTKLWRGLPVAHCDGTPYMASRQCYLSWPHTKFLAGGALLARIEIERMRQAGA